MKAFCIKIPKEIASRFLRPKSRWTAALVVIPEDCPTPIDITIGGCEDTVVFDAGALAMQSQGRILQLDVTLKSVCPGKRVALAVIMNEVDASGNEYKRGLKTMTIPAHTAATCQDVEVRCITFVFPEDLDVSAAGSGLCGSRSFKAPAHCALY